MFNIYTCEKKVLILCQMHSTYSLYPLTVFGPTRIILHYVYLNIEKSCKLRFEISKGLSLFFLYFFFFKKILKQKKKAKSILVYTLLSSFRLLSLWLIIFKNKTNFYI